MKEQTNKLHDEYLKQFGKIKENEGVLTAEAYHAFVDNLQKEYTREYALMDGRDGIENDKKIEELGTARDKELAEMKLEHERLNAELKLRSDKQRYDCELQGKIAKAKAELLSEELVPADLPKRWWQRRARPNYAKRLMLRELSVEVDKYFADREEEIARLEDEYIDTDIAGLLLRELPQPKGRRAWEKHAAHMHKIAGMIKAMLHTAADAEAAPEQKDTETKPKRQRKAKQKAEEKPGELPGQIAMELPKGET